MKHKLILNYSVLIRLFCKKINVAFNVLATSQDILKTDGIDLCLLNSASPIMAFEVISGKRIFTNDLHKTAKFESLVMCEYEDENARLQHCRNINF